MKITELLQKQRLYSDGGMGTLLQERGLRPGELPERWSLTHPDEIRTIHRAYCEAGSQVISTNTFGANIFKFSREELGQIIESRSFYFHKPDSAPSPVLAEGGNHYVSCAMPILSEGDIVGCVASVTDQTDSPRQNVPDSEVESKLILTAAGFLGRQLEP